MKKVNINKTIIKRDEETADLEHDDAQGNGNAVNQGLLREVFE